MPSCGAETHLFFSHETIDASDTSASRTWGLCRPASPNTPSEANYEARNETEECLGSTMVRSDVRGGVTDGADSPAAVGSSDRAKALALQLLPGWRRLRVQTWVALATSNGQALASVVSGRATRGGERRNAAAYGHAISLGAFRTILGVGVDEAGSIS